jgi:hypothetical protein
MYHLILEAKIHAFSKNKKKSYHSPPFELFLYFPYIFHAQKSTTFGMHKKILLKK